MKQKVDKKLDTEYPSMVWVSRLSLGSWEVAAMLPGSSFWLPRLRSLMKLIRPGRVLMISLLTWVIAYALRLGPSQQVRIVLAGMFLGMAGFALDMYADCEVDKHGGRLWPINPLAAGMMTQSAARRWIAFFMIAGVAFCASVHPLALLPAAVLLLVYWGLAQGVLDRPIVRAITLGLLQALYVLLASAATGTIPLVMMGVATVLFVAMFGARAAADIRDLPHDALVQTRSLPKAYGVRVTSWIMPVAITTAAGIALYISTLGFFDADYLLWTLLAFGPGVVLAWSFVLRPTPNYAFALAWPYWSIGLLYMIALVLGST